MSLSALPRTSLGRRLWRSFMLQAAQQRSAGRTVGQSTEARLYFERATAQHDAAQAMLENDNVGTALELAKASAVLYARAQLTADGIKGTASRDPEIWTAFGARLRASDVPKIPRRMGDPLALMTRIPELQVTDALPSEAIASVGQVLEFLGWLRGISDCRSLVDIKHQRIRRVVGLGVISAACIGGIAYAVVVPKNLALHRPVAVSSNHPATLAAEGDLVDGIIDQPYGVHTNVEAAPWVSVDLGKVRKLGKVKVYNRGDVLFDEVLPLALELSTDGTNFTEVERRTTSFSQTAPWVALLGGKEARYIRLSGKPNGWIALSELEAYGP